MTNPIQLHPDFPAFEPGGDKWNAPDPILDLLTALDEDSQRNGLTYSDLATVEAYYIASDAGQWPACGSVATELNMILLGTLGDGRWFGLEAWNDYTGWGCQDGSDVYVGPTREDVIANGLTVEGRTRLGLTVPA